MNVAARCASVVAVALAYLGCASARREPPAIPEQVGAPAERPVPPVSSGDEWMDLETLSVEIHTGRTRARSVPVRASSLPRSFAADAALQLPEILLDVDTTGSPSTGGAVVARATDTGREIFRHPLPIEDPSLRSSVEDERLLVIAGNATATVVDVLKARLLAREKGSKKARLPLGIAQTFDENVRWIGGHRWSSGDLLLSSDKRLARIEFQSTSPEYVGSTVWSLPPVSGARGGAVLTGDVDSSPLAVKKFAVFFGYDPDRDTPITLAFVEALARGEDGAVPRERFRGTIEPLGTTCGSREVGVVGEGDTILVAIACDRGAVVERRSVPDGKLLSRVELLRHR